LAEVQAAVAALPAELVVGVSERHAEAAAAALRAAGCDAEAVLPRPR